MTNRLETVQSIFRRYQAFSARGNYVVAMSLYERGKVEAQPADKKILFIYLFYILLNSCESVIRLVRILRDLRNEDPLKNLLRNDQKDLSTKNLNLMRDQIGKYQDKPVDFFTEYWGLEVSNPEKEAGGIKGIILGIQTALNNMLAYDEEDIRILWDTHNRFKHGFTVLDKEDKESVVIYTTRINPDKSWREVPIEVKVNEQNAKKWLDTIHALSNTQQNISHLLGSTRIVND